MIEVRGLVHRLSSSGSRPRVLFDGLEFSVERGEVVLLMGRNGSGKTTLARYLAGLLIPNEGTITVDGIRTDQDPREVRHRVGLLFQESHAHLIAQTPLEDVAFGLENLALPSSEIERRAWRALERVALTGRALCPLESLTPAELQRVALAGVLALDPDYYILDEPDRTADREGLTLLLALVRELRAQGKGVLIISHKGFWMEHADRVVYLEHGKVVEGGGVRIGTSSPSLCLPVRETEPFRVHARELSFTYDTAPVLKDFSAEITPGELIVVTGPAGSGKTTLVELLAGLMQPTRGCVLWNGVPITMLRASERVRCVGLVFQEPYHQLLGESVREELLLGLMAQGIDGSEGERRARWACEAVGLDWEQVQEQPSHHLSGGEQARLAIAAMLALCPRMLILDEALAALDPEGQLELLGLLQGISAKGATVLIVTSEIIPHLGSRLWVLEGGQLIYDGPPRLL
ncbi:MAG: ATP-binding cassette domain-containing protein [Candidatus Bipolaricaulota bacterium]|nr:ATP-binding cassette domain-containing protein [Candidatus Bipolaricaulota bacterium]